MDRPRTNHLRKQFDFKAIETTLSEGCTIADLAPKMGVSRRTLSRLREEMPELDFAIIKGKQKARLAKVLTQLPQSRKK